VERLAEKLTLAGCRPSHSVCCCGTEHPAEAVAKAAAGFRGEGKQGITISGKVPARLIFVSLRFLRQGSRIAGGLCRCPSVACCRWVNDGHIQKPALLVELQIASLQGGWAQVVVDNVHALPLRLRGRAEGAAIFLCAAAEEPADAKGFPYASLQHSMPVVDVAACHAATLVKTRAGGHGA
jgi:hypothetical protein